MTTLATKLARNEADLTSAAAQGSEAFHAVLFQKLAELNLDVEDRQAIMDMLHEEREKTAAPGGFGIGHALALGSILVPAAMAGAKWLANRNSYDEGWNSLQMAAPDVIAHDPVRARSIYDLLHSTAPSVASNPVVAADLMRQMTAMPMVDLGSVKTMTEVGKNLGGITEHQHRADDYIFDPLDKYKNRAEAFNMLTGQKTSSLKLAVRHIAKDGTPCVFDWSTPAMKEAGITDAFTPGFSGNGTTMDQANTATQLNDMSSGQSLLPLDAVVRELIAKEMELSQREQILQQQEMQMQQAMAMQQQLGGMYQQQYGVDPSTGQPAGQPGEEPAQDPSAAGQDPSAGQAPPEQDLNAPAQQDPVQVAQDAGQGQLVPQDPAAAPPPAEDPSAAAAPPPPAEGQDPNAAAAAPPAEDPTAAAPPPPAEGQDPNAAPPQGQDPNAPVDAGPIPQSALLQAAGAPVPPAGPQMVAGPDGLHLDIPLPSLHLHIKTAEVAKTADPLEAEKQEALATFNDLFSDIFCP